MNFTQEYRDKRISAEEAVKAVRSGDIVDYGFFNGKPVLLDQALASRAEELREVSVYTAVSLPPLPAVTRFPESFTFIDWQWSKLTRQLRAQGASVYYCPVLYHRGPFYLREMYSQDPNENLSPSLRSAYYNDPSRAGKVRTIAMVQVGPMDGAGFFNLGPQNSETSAKLEAADVVIIEVNPNMPVCLGGNEESVHISRVHHVVEASAEQKLFESPQASPSAVDEQIARHIMNLN